MYCILAINPGSTSTKVALYEDENVPWSESIVYSKEQLSGLEKVIDQFEMRRKDVRNLLSEKEIDLKSLSAVVGRGGPFKPLKSGTYRIDENLLNDIKAGNILAEHISNIGVILAHEIAMEAGIPAFFVDPVVVDEMEPVARISGMPELERRSLFHALNQKAVARRAAQELEKDYEEVNLIVAHLGGGISVGVHKEGRVVDVNNALNGDGPFAPERAGGLPAGQLVDLCFSGKYKKDELKRRLVGNAGMVAYLGTNDLREVKRMMEAGIEKARLIYEAMAFQVAKEIGSCAAVLKGDVDGIVFSGGLTHDESFVGMIREFVRWIGRIFVYPGEEEMEALVRGVFRVLRGEEEAKVY